MPFLRSVEEDSKLRFISCWESVGNARLEEMRPQSSNRAAHLVPLCSGIRLIACAAFGENGESFLVQVGSHALAPGDHAGSGYHNKLVGFGHLLLRSDYQFGGG